MPHLQAEKATFDRHLPKLQAEHSTRDWVVVHGDEIDVFKTFEEAAETAVCRYGSGPYLIRQIEREPLCLSSGLMTYGEASI